MKAIRLGATPGLDNLQVADVADPGAPGPGQIRVQIYANSLNYHDYAVAVGGLPSTPGRVLMSDGAGVVESVGEGVTEFAPGDHVVSVFFPYWQDGEVPHSDFSYVPGDGIDGFAQEIVVKPVTWFTRAPKGWSHAEAATLPCAALTAWRALVVEGNIKAGDSVLILGTGGVAVAALQLAKMMGATVIITSSSDAKLEKARVLGADHTVNYKTDTEWGKTVLNLTGGRGVDHVLEIGGPGTLPQSITATRIGGNITMIGILTGISGEVPTILLMLKQIKLKGVIVGSRVHQQDMIRAIDAGGMRPVIDRSFPLSGTADAFRYEEGAQHFGKICVEI
jgi:NADPH:quinone reductase-like Zn-dependent oxidoreductase